MISRKTIFFLVLAAVAAVIAAVLLSREGPAPAPPSLFPDLPGRIKEVREVRLKSAQGEVTLARENGRWLVREKEGYPASNARLRELFQGLVGLSAPEAKTRNPELYERVGLDPERGEKPGRLIMLDGDGKAVVDLWIGKTRALVTDLQRNEYFVRRGEEPQVWRVEGRLPTEAVPVSWIDRQILTLERTRIRAVAVVPREGPTYRVARASAEASEFALEGLGPDEKIEAPLRIGSLVSAVQNLNADDVLGRDSAAPMQEHGQVTIETFDGLKVELQLLKADSRRYAQLTASGEGTEAVVQEAARLNERWSNWTYQLADYQADSLFAKRTDLVQSADAQAKTATPAAKAKATPPKGHVQKGKQRDGH